MRASARLRGLNPLCRRLAKLSRAPFVKVEASKYTEVGYVGRDCESMIRDLMEGAVALVREELRQEVRERAAATAEDKVLQILVPPPPVGAPAAADPKETRERYRERLRAGQLDERPVEIEVDEEAPGLEMLAPQAGEEAGVNLKDLLPGMFTRTRKRTVSVAEARRIPIATRVIVGAQDQITPPANCRRLYDALVAASPGLAHRFDLVAEAGHAVCQERPDEIARLVMEH